MAEMIEIFDIIYPRYGIKSRVSNIGRPISSTTATRVTTFFGLPNELRDGELEQSFMSILKNLIGYQSNASELRRAFNFILMPLMFIFNLISIPIKFVTNIAKFFTEFVWLNMKDALNESIEMLRPEPTYSIGLFITSNLLILATRILKFIPDILFFVGRAITSPINNLADMVDEFQYGGNLDKILAVFKGVVSLGVTFIFYALVFPMTLQLVAGPIFHAIGQLPQAVQHVLSIINKVLSDIGKSLVTPLCKVVIKGATFGAANTSFLANINQTFLGLFGGLGSFAPPLGFLVQSIRGSIAPTSIDSRAPAPETAPVSDEAPDIEGSYIRATRTMRAHPTSRASRTSGDEVVIDKKPAAVAAASNPLSIPKTENKPAEIQEYKFSPPRRK